MIFGIWWMNARMVSRGDGIECVCVCMSSFVHDAQYYRSAAGSARIDGHFTAYQTRPMSDMLGMSSTVNGWYVVGVNMCLSTSFKTDVVQVLCLLTMDHVDDSRL